MKNRPFCSCPLLSQSTPSPTVVDEQLICRCTIGQAVEMIQMSLPSPSSLIPPLSPFFLCAPLLLFSCPPLLPQVDPRDGSPHSHLLGGGGWSEECTVGSMLLALQVRTHTHISCTGQLTSFSLNAGSSRQSRAGQQVCGEHRGSQTVARSSSHIPTDGPGLCHC